MPKKSTSARSGVQRTKPKAQKSFELVRPVSEVQEPQTEETLTPENSADETVSATPVISKASSELNALPTVPKKKDRSSSVATATAPIVPIAPKVADIEAPVTALNETPVSALKGNASTRLAARRNAQRVQQRSSASLITPEHYSYVRKDLAFIAVLAAIMFIAIVVLYFVPGIGV